MGARRISGPTVEPLTLAQAKAHLRYELDDQDDAIMSFVATARDLVEQRLERPLLLQTWELRAPSSTGYAATTSSMVVPAGLEWTDSHVDDFVHNKLQGRSGSPYAAGSSRTSADCGLELYFAAPLDAIETITIDGVTAAVDAYAVDPSVEPARLYLAEAGDLVVTYTVGVPTVDLVPPALLGAVRSMLGILWVYRGQLPPGSEIEAVLATVDPYAVKGALV